MLRNKRYVYGAEAPEVPVHLQFGQDLLRKIWSYGDDFAVINADTRETLTYRQFAQQAVDVALSLTKRGITVGQRVSICSEKRQEVLPVVLGIICSGATFSPADISCKGATLLHRVNIAKPTLMFCSPEAWESHRETLQQVDSLNTFVVFGEEVKGALSFDQFLTEHGPVEDFLATPVEPWKDLAVILYSSGTTGLPKGIPLTHLNFIPYVSTTIGKSNYRGKGMLSTREWAYTYGLTYSLSCIRTGATIVYTGRNTVDDMLLAIQTYKVYSVQLAPSTIVQMLKSEKLAQYDVGSLQRMVSASTPADAELVNQAKSKFPNLQDVYQLYGMSEVGALCTEEGTGRTKPGSVGPPNAGAVIKVVDQNTREPLGPNQRGELCIKAPGLFPGYMNSSSREHLDEEGFLLTGDIGYYDEDGYFFITSRLKELIKFDSFQVAPGELEAVLQLHPSVLEAGVVGAPHERFGEAPLAFVVLQPGAKITEEELVAYVDTQVKGALSFDQFLTEHGPVEDFLATPVEPWKDLAVILYSSGTTGLPKGIPLTHLNFIPYVSTTIGKSNYRGKGMLSTREWAYTYGLTYSLSCIRTGATIVYTGRNTVDDMLLAIQTYKVYSVQLAPSTIVQMLKSEKLAQYDVGSLQRMVSASTPADAELVNLAKSKFPNLQDVYQLYGMSEVGALCTEEGTGRTKPGSVGPPNAGAVIKVVDQNTREPLGPNQRGELCIMAPGLFPGYMNSSTREHLDEEGFLLTGDIGYYDEDGYFFIVSRLKELIKFDSFQVAPGELEAVLQLHPSVLEAGVVGAPHESFGEAPLAFVVLQPGAKITEEELVAYVDTQVSKRMRLEGGVRFIAALPRGAGEKLDRKALKLLL